MTLGEIECRKRATGPMPPNSPKKVGLSDRLYPRRLPWLTNPPPLNGLRTRNARPVLFTMLIDGWRFHVP